MECIALYHDAKQVPYETPAFSPDFVVDLEQFGESRSSVHRSAIRYRRWVGNVWRLCNADVGSGVLVR